MVLALFIVEVRVEFLLSTVAKLFTKVVFLLVAVCIFASKVTFKLSPLSTVDFRFEYCYKC